MIICSNYGIWYFYRKYLKCLFIINLLDFFLEFFEFGEIMLDLFGEFVMIDCNVCIIYNEILVF